MNSDDLGKVKENFSEIIEFFKDDLKTVRTGRANIGLVENLEIEYFGSRTPLQQAASVSTSDARTIVISPWSKDSLVDVEKAIRESDLNINPTNDGNVIRLCFPALTEERRLELVKIVGKKTEDARIKIRKVREDAWDKIQKMEKDGEISEDDKFTQKDSLQSIVDEFNKRIEEISKEKEVEIMQV
ncbi:ribosome recycling factor [bacterium]|jgi:ribosome recycling factor|nr:ribosome recycling factor [bacterium]MBT4250877.1 ribosome recycling factor [bacterium]MBT4597590.1 ribosome recycling factor [bacterium]MBT6754055.1 ribosome recycling factor [bacterium]MBT7038085.1 ribosome recycling factor [bacterium]